jgi:biotin synthase
LLCRNEDEKMFDLLGLRSRPAFMNYPSGNDSSRHFDAQETAAAAAATPARESAAESGCCGGGCGSKQQQATA